MSSYRDDKDKKDFKQTKSSFSSIDFSSLENQPLNITASGAEQPIQTTDPSNANSSNNPQDDPVLTGKQKIKSDFRKAKQQIRRENANNLGFAHSYKSARQEKRQKMKDLRQSPNKYLNPNTLEVQGDAGQVEQPNRAGRPVNSNVLMNDPMNYQDPSKVSAQQNNQAQLFSGLSSSMGDNPEPMIPGQQDQSITPGQQAPFQKKAWINKAIKKPGQLHRDLGVPEGEKIPSSKLDAALAGQYGKKTKQRAELAKTLSKFKK
jgi:hypothetical protein